MKTDEVYLWKELYGFFKVRYCIKIDNQTSYYYDKYSFIKNIFKIFDINKIENSIDDLKLGKFINNII